MKTLLLSILIFSIPLSEAITLAHTPTQPTPPTSTSTSLLITLNNTTTIGNTVIAMCDSYNLNNPVASDSGSNSYTTDKDINNGPAENTIASAHIGTTSTTNTCTSGGSSPYWAPIIAEYSGVLASSPLDTTSSATGSGTAITCGTLTTTNANDLLIVTVQLVGGATFSSPSSGFTIESQATQPGYTASMMMDSVVSSTGSYSPSVTSNTSSSWVCIAAAYKAAAAPPASTNMMPMVQ